MRVRVREITNGRTWKLELPSGASYDHLKNAVASECFPSGDQSLQDASKITLSLNKKDPIISEPNAPLSTLGICNGDLVWVLAPLIPPSSAPEPPVAISVDAPVPTALPSPAATAQPTPSPSPPADHMDTDPSSSDFQLPESAQPADYVPIPIGLRIPGHLLRAFCAYDGITTSPQGILLLTAHAAMLETGFEVNSGNSSNNIFTNVTSSLHRVSYKLKGQSADIGCVLTCSSMGQSVLIATEVAHGQQARHILLNWDNNKAANGENWVVPIEHASSSIQKAMNEGNNAADILDPCPHVRVTSGQDVILHGSWVMEYPKLTVLWRKLKDQVALPSLAAACMAAGLSPPAGLLTLPAEVKEAVLRLLPALDLAALGATCSEMRHMAAANDLWKPLFKAEFPSPPVEIAESAETRGYKWAYAHCFLERRRLQEESKRRRQRRYVIPGIPHFGPRPPFYPSPAPPGFPGMIGGDQDRLPFLGGTGSVGIGGGTMFGLGGSNARRQGMPFGGGSSGRWY